MKMVRGGTFPISKSHAAFSHRTDKQAMQRLVPFWANP